MSTELLRNRNIINKEAKEDLEILLEHYPIECSSCGYTVDKAIRDCHNSGSFRCQNCGSFKHFVNEVLFEEIE